MEPVVVWVLGGADQISSPNDYPGLAWARNEDVIVVTIGYRLGAFGFVDLSALGDEFAGTAPGGYRDETEALRWVRRNIADFGGEPGNVTLVGRPAASCGAW